MNQALFTKPTSVIAFAFGLAVSFLVAAVGTMAQDSSESFETPTIPGSRTIGGLAYGGEESQLEGIDAESAGSKATLQEPNFGEYGPVTGPRPSSQAADQAPALDRKIEVIDSSTPLPNQYNGETIEPDWLSSANAPQEAEPVDRIMRSIRGSAGTSNQMSSPRLRIDSLNDVESENRNFNSDRPHEVVRERYEDGNVKIVRTVTQDQEGNYYNDGGWLMYDRQQRPIASGTFDRGAMHGSWERIHEPGGGLFSQIPFSLFEGPYKSSATFKRNRLDGVWRITDRNDRLICSITYKDGVRDGKATWFYPRNGQKMREAEFKKGVPDGLVLQWDQQGKVTSRDRFVDGRKLLTRKTTFANQSIESQREFRDQQLSPVGTDNWWAAKPATFDRTGQPIQHGSVAQWYPNRQPKMTGRYVDGRRDGLFTWWHPTHNKKAEGKFVEGMREGLWRYWHESGMKRSEGEFKDDQPWGLWRSWNRDGKLVDERTFPEEDTLLLAPEIDENSEGETSESEMPARTEQEASTDGKEEAKTAEDSGNESDDIVIDLGATETESDSSPIAEVEESEPNPDSEEPLEDIQAEMVDPASDSEPGSLGVGQ